MRRFLPPGVPAALLAGALAVGCGYGVTLAVASTGNCVSPSNDNGKCTSGGTTSTSTTTATTDTTTTPTDTTTTDATATPEPGLGDTETESPEAVPELGRAVAVAPSKGTIEVHSPGSGEWKTLDASAGVPVGSLVDARHGHLTLRSALPGGGYQEGTFWGGMFLVRQAADGTVELVLLGARAACPRHATARAASVRRTGLWGHDHGGRFRTRGRNSVATVRGTIWFVGERCGGTLTKVAKGKVAVRDLRTGHVTVLHAGQSHLARRG